MSKKPPPSGGGAKRNHASIARNANSTNDNDAEQALLASLGSSVQNMDQYEEDVLRTAEYDAVPKLSGTGGFPDLGSIVTMGAPLSQVSNMQAVLGKLRADDLPAKPHNLKFLLKQQMLLNLLHSTTKDPELCVRPKEEAKQEEERRKRFRKQISKQQRQQQQQQQELESTANANIDNLINPPRKSNAKKTLAPPKSVLKGSKKRSLAPENENEQPQQDDNDNDDDSKKTAGDRLEDIKRGKKSVSFAADLKPGQKSKRPRVGIQQRKHQTLRQNRHDSDGTNIDEDDFQKHKEHLLKLRKEREERRRQRRNRWVGATAKTKNTAEAKSDGDMEGEHEFQDDAEETSNQQQQQQQYASAKQETLESGEPHQTNSQQSNVKTEESPPSAAESNPDDTSPMPAGDADGPPDATPTPNISGPTKTQTATVSCPLCRQTINAASQEKVDEALSEHMSICGNTRTRGQRRSARARRAVNYAENDDDDPMEEDARKEDQDEKEQAPKQAARLIVKMEDNENDDYDDDEDDIAVVDEDDEDVELIVDGKDEALDDVKNSETTKARLPAPTAVDDWDEDDYEDRVDDWVENGVQSMRVMKERDVNETPPGEEVYDGGLVIPAWINDRLFPYQRTALQWMWELHRQQAGGIIGDEMGLGKTVQICAFLGSMISSRKMKSVLIISPATMLQHWLKEIAKWAPGLRRILVHQSADSTNGDARSVSPALLKTLEKWLKGARRSRLFEAIDDDDFESRDPASFCGTGYAFITTYENVRRSPETWINHNWSYIVMDEAQKIRNPDADITLVCKRLKTPHRLALSGTPIQNDLRELWSLFDFVFPGRLGTLPAFEHEFADPIKRGGYSNASPMQVQLAYRCSLILRDLINPYLLRRLKKDIKEVNRMPGKKEQVLFCRLSDRQREMYEAYLQSDQVKGVLRGSIQLLGAITMLRKICNHPDLVCPPDQTSVDSFLRNGYLNEADLQGISDDDGSVSEEQSLTERSGKLEVLAKILPLWKEQGHRVLIFCQWKKMLNIIQRFTELQGWKFGRLDGNTNVAARQRLVDNFNSDDSYYGMLCTTRTGGVGLNLTGADRIILYDPDWNPQTDAQARERAWRFGQEREVTVYRLIVAGTVEEKIYQRQIFKTALSNRVLQDPKQRRLFSQKDLKDLFSLKADSGSVIGGGDGSTETSELTNGDGYVDPDEAHDEKDEEASCDDGETLRTVFRSKGLAGVFDHDIVEKNDVAKKTSVREMEAKAKKIARQALHALEESVIGDDIFNPTWTGSTETQGGRFGGNAQGGSVAGLFGGGKKGATAGVQVGGGNSSSSLLASIRKRDEDIRTLGKSETKTKDAKHYTQLLKRIRDFVKRKVPTSDELIEEFESVSNHDAAVFRRLLKSVAIIEDGRWHLKKK